MSIGAAGDRSVLAAFNAYIMQGQSMDNLKFLSFNCRGLGSQEKRRDVLDYLKNLKYDVYLLQDTHLTSQKETFCNTLWRGKCYHAFGTFNSRGTSILFSPRTNHKIIYEDYCPEGNYALIVVTILSNTYTIINLYGPNEDRPAFFRHIKQKLDELPYENVIIGGDFNFVLDYKRDSNYHRQNNPRARDTFAQIIEELGFVDAWAELNPGQRTFTWSKQNPHKFGRLDMFFVSDHLVTNGASSSVRAGYRSDHSIVVLQIEVLQKRRGPGLWKFNDSLLNDKDYDDVIKQLIINVIKQYAVPIYADNFLSDPMNFDQIQFTISDHLFYETLLMMIRGETVKFSKRKARKNREKEDEITNIISSIRHSLHSNSSLENLKRLEEAQQALEDIRKPKIQGLITRSRVKWHEDGEKCSKYFLSLEKRNTMRNSIQSLIINNSITTDKGKILEHFSENLRKKYTKNDTADADAYLHSTITQKLSDENKRILDAPISLNELRVALSGMKKGKTPGSNGFTADFFRHFWTFIGNFLYRAWFEKFLNNKNISSHNEGIVTLIPKSGTSHNSPKGWRPISLLNVDFKIISSAVAIRLKTVIHQLISPSQTAYIQGRFIGENSRLVYDIIEHLNNTSSSGIIMAVDFEAAFDTVSWEFLLGALDKYNFGHYFKKLIRTLYLNPELSSRISLEGNLGSKIYMGRGIRQGDPISGYLFNLIMEPLANQLKYSTIIKGIQTSSGRDIRISQYADDLIVFSSPQSNSISGVLQELNKFTEVSGLRTNVEKTKCLPIGNNVNTSALIDLGLTVVNELKVLGINFGTSNINITSNNVTVLLPNITKEIAQWQRRNLTLIGKITVVKSLLLSKLVHVLSALPNPDEALIKKLNSILFRFIWNNGPDKIKRSELVQDYKDGGLKMIDVHSFLAGLKVSWFKRLYWADHDVEWANIAKDMLPSIETLACFGSTKLKDLSKKLNNQFWSHVILSWADFCAAYKPDVDEVLSDKLWFSDNTRYTKTIINKWDRKGLRFISDLFSKEDGTLHTREYLSATYNVRMTFLCYTSMIRSIPAQLQHNVNNARKVVAPIFPYKIALLSKKVCTNRIAYASLVRLSSNGGARAKLERKWIRDVGQMHIGTLRDIRFTTKNTYLQSLHFRIVKRIIATNTFLYRIGKAENPLCTFCKRENETLLHVLWSCDIVQRFVREVTNDIRSKFNIILRINKRNWFFPSLENESIINILVITVAKHTIFRSKYRDFHPNTDIFLALLKLEASKERGAALRAQALNKFENKWGDFANILRA